MPWEGKTDRQGDAVVIHKTTPCGNLPPLIRVSSSYCDVSRPIVFDGQYQYGTSLTVKWTCNVISRTWQRRLPLIGFGRCVCVIMVLFTGIYYKLLWENYWVTCLLLLINIAFQDIMTTSDRYNTGHTHTLETSRHLYRPLYLLQNTVALFIVNI